MSSYKTVRSRSNKNIGDMIEGTWEIVGKTVVAEPFPGDRARGVAPRLGIYDYEVKPAVQQAPETPARSKRKQKEQDFGGTRREASSVALTVRR